MILMKWKCMHWLKIACTYSKYYLKSSDILIIIKTESGSASLDTICVSS